MKNTIKFLLLFLGIAAMAQEPSVSTLTPEFKGSGGLSLDGDGNLYIGDFGDFLSAGDGDGQPNNVWKLDPDLNLTQFSTNFIGASGNAFDSDGILHQSDIGAGAIYKIINGVRTFVTNTGISQPVGIVFDSNDNFYVCNCGNNTIRKVTPGGDSTLFSSGTLFSCPNGITIDEDDNLYVSNFSNGNIIKVDQAGNPTLLNTTPGGSTSSASNGHLDYHQPSRRLYIASHGSNRIYWLSVDEPGNLQLLAGSGVRGNDDGTATTATFSRPNGVAVTQSGDSIYINSAIPVTNTPNRPLNPQVIRLIKGVQSTLSVETVTIPSKSLKTYPNPAEDRVTIELNLVQNHSNLSLEIFSLEGKLILSMPDLVTSGGYLKVNLDVSKLSSGNYLLRFSDSGDQLISGQLIIK